MITRRHLIASAAAVGAVAAVPIVPAIAHVNKRTGLHVLVFTTTNGVDFINIASAPLTEQESFVDMKLDRPYPAKELMYELVDYDNFGAVIYRGSCKPQQKQIDSLSIYVKDRRISAVLWGYSKKIDSALVFC